MLPALNVFKLIFVDSVVCVWKYLLVFGCIWRCSVLIRFLLFFLGSLRQPVGAQRNNVAKEPVLLLPPLRNLVTKPRRLRRQGDLSRGALHQFRALQFWDDIFETVATTPLRKDETPLTEQRKAYLDSTKRNPFDSVKSSGSKGME